MSREGGLGGGLLWRGDGASWTSAPARSLPLPRVTGARVCMSGVFVEMVYGQGKGEKERGRAIGAARVRPLIGALGRPWRGCEGGSRREK